MSQVAVTAGKFETGQTLTLANFESAELNPEDFTHEQHIRMAWLLLREADLLEAITRYREALKKITRKFGAETKYHETITWFFLVTIAERMETIASIHSKECWISFRTANWELFEGNPSWLERNYSGERLTSELARRQFVLPDRLPLND